MLEKCDLMICKKGTLVMPSGAFSSFEMGDQKRSNLHSNITSEKETIIFFKEVSARTLM